MASSMRGGVSSKGVLFESQQFGDGKRSELRRPLRKAHRVDLEARKVTVQVISRAAMYQQAHYAWRVRIIFVRGLWMIVDADWVPFQPKNPTHGLKSRLPRST
jgi:hypothetical protein